MPARYPVPWTTQYATPSLIEAIAYHGHPPAEDPNWPASGAPTQQDYGYWCPRWCGMACLHMALTARDGTAPTLWDLLTGCLGHDGYIQHPDGRVTGLIYQPFTEFARDRYQVRSEIITDLTPARLIHELTH